jgi:hypothetical protein
VPSPWRLFGRRGPRQRRWRARDGWALVAGCLATTLFLRARNRSTDPFRIAVVDATQAGDLAFALAGEIVLLGAALPGAAGWLGLGAVTAGLAGFIVRR